MSRREISHHAQRRPLLLVRLAQNAQKRRRYIAQLPWWRHPIVGYLLSIPLSALALMVPWLIGPNYFLGAPFFLVTVLVALLWGTGPAIFSVLLGVIALDYFFIPPPGISLKNWDALLPFTPYFVAELFVALITAQREAARQRALFAEQEIQEHADELEQINRQLGQANQLKDMFLSRASHELKTPLTTIRGQAQIGLRRLEKQPELPGELGVVHAALQRVEEQSYRLQTLIDDLMDLSVLSTGKVKLRLKRCDLNNLCRQIVEDQRLLSGRTIELELPENPVILRIDSDRLSQVITNLLTNAIKYSTENSAVQVQVVQQPAGALIKVHNVGSVIPPQQQKDIFEPFYRASNAQSSAKQGWGLGLAICRDIVEQHNGSIWVESSKEAGTTFFVELPN